MLSSPTRSQESAEESRVSRLAVVRGHSFFPHLLGPDSVVVDLGGNRGEFAGAICERFACRCLVVEPNPDLFDAIDAPGVEKFRLAITARDGPATFHVAVNAEASSLLAPRGVAASRSVEVEGRVLSRFLLEQHVDRLDLLKVDIEGAEIAMFDSLTDAELARWGQLTVEFHDFCGLIPRGEVLRIKRRLQRLGFFALKICRHGFLDMLFVNRRLARLSGVELAYTSTVVPRLASLLRGTACWQRRLSNLAKVS